MTVMNIVGLSLSVLSECGRSALGMEKLVKCWSVNFVRI